MKYLYSLLLLCLVALSCSRCKEECDDPTDPECPNYVAPDPCANSREVSAEFVIEQMYDALGDGEFAEVNHVTCLKNNQPQSIQGTSLIRLRPKQTGHHYKWILGTDTIEGPDYSFVFPNSLCGGEYPITLIVSGTVDSTCFPLDNGTDTLTRMVKVYNFYEQEIWGDYRVSDMQSPFDSFDVSIVCFQIPEVLTADFYLYGFAPGAVGDSCRYSSWGYAYNFLDFYTNLSPCGQVRGSLWLNQNLELEGEYQYTLDTAFPDPAWISKRIKGRKLS
jgi:hypothetical protein